MFFFPFKKNNLGFWVFLVHPETSLPDGLVTSGRRAYLKFWHISRCFEFLRYGWFFPFFQKIGYLGILGPPYCGIGATICIGQEMLCLLYAIFFLEILNLEGHLNCCIGSKVTAILLIWWILLLVESQWEGSALQPVLKAVTTFC